MEQQEMNAASFIRFKIAILTVASAERFLVDADIVARDFIRFLSSLDSDVKRRYMADVANRFNSSNGNAMGRDFDMNEVLATDAIKLFKAKQNRHPYYINQDGQFIVSDDKVKKVKKQRPVGREKKPIIELDPSDIIILKPGEKLDSKGNVVPEKQKERPVKKRPDMNREHARKIKRPIIEDELVRKDPIIKRPRDMGEPSLRPILNKEKILQRAAEKKERRQDVAAKEKIKRAEDEGVVVKPVIRKTEEERQLRNQPAKDNRSQTEQRIKINTTETHKSDMKGQRIIIKSEIIIKPRSKGFKSDILKNIGRPEQRVRPSTASVKTQPDIMERPTQQTVRTKTVVAGAQTMQNAQTASVNNVVNQRADNERMAVNKNAMADERMIVNKNAMADERMAVNENPTANAKVVSNVTVNANVAERVFANENSNEKAKSTASANTTVSANSNARMAATASANSAVNDRPAQIVKTTIITKPAEALRQTVVSKPAANSRAEAVRPSIKTRIDANSKPAVSNSRMASNSRPATKMAVNSRSAVNSRTAERTRTTLSMQRPVQSQASRPSQSRADYERLRLERQEALRRREAERREYFAKLTAAREARLKEIRERAASRQTSRPTRERVARERMTRESLNSLRTRRSEMRTRSFPEGISDTRRMIERTMEERRRATQRRIEEIKKRRELLKSGNRYNPHITYEIHIG